jgi:hypothetical protein
MPDFGSNVFSGAPRWLEIAVRSNTAATSFTPLVPRQMLTPTPYALFAQVAGRADSVAPASIGRSGLQPGAVTAETIAPGAVVKTLNGLTDKVTLTAAPGLMLTTNAGGLLISPAGGVLSGPSAAGKDQLAVFADGSASLLANRLATLDTNNMLTLPSGRLTSSIPTVVVSQTWSNSSVRFKAVEIFVTNEAAIVSGNGIDQGSSAFIIYGKRGSGPLLPLFDVDSTGVAYAGHSLYAEGSNTLGWWGRSKMRSPADGVVTLLNSAATGFTSLNFGDVSSSNASLRTASDGSAMLRLRTGADSADADLGAGVVKLNKFLELAVTAPPSPPLTNSIRVYAKRDSTGTSGLYYQNDAGTEVGPLGSALNLSDRNSKRDFAPVDAQEVLRQVVALPIQRWTYTNDLSKARHLGPMAQDFHAAFHLGNDGKSIHSVDAEGVALSAIQGLNKLLQAKDKQITALEARVRKLERLMNQLDKDP